MSLAQASEFKDRFQECEIGAMSPFGNLYGMPVDVDESLTNDKDIAFNAGSSQRAAGRQLRRLRTAGRADGPEVFTTTGYGDGRVAPVTSERLLAATVFGSRREFRDFQCYRLRQKRFSIARCWSWPVIHLPAVAANIVLLFVLSSIKILREYERGVISCLGRLQRRAKGASIIPVFFPVDHMVRISLCQGGARGKASGHHYPRQRRLRMPLVYNTALTIRSILLA